MAEPAMPHAIESGAQDIAMPAAHGKRRSKTWPVRLAVAAGSALMMVGLAMLALFLTLSAGPVSAPFIKSRVANALESRIGRGIDVDVGDAKLEKSADGLAVHVYDVVFRDARGKEILRSPEAMVALDPLRLAALQIVPRRLALQGMVVKAQVGVDGDINLTTEDRSGGQAQSVGIADVLAVLVDVARTGTFSGLNAISIEDARLLVDDRRVGREIAFERVRATFENMTPGRSAIAGSLTRGRATVPFRLDAQQQGEGADLVLTTSQVPLSFAATLGGNDSLHISSTSTAALSANLRLAADGRPLSGEAVASLTPGKITVPAFSGIEFTLQEAKLEAEWRGAGDRIDNVTLKLRGDTLTGALAGPLLLPTSQRPEFSFDGRTTGLALAPAGPAEAPLTVTEGRLKARLHQSVDRLTIDDLALDGPETAIHITADIRKADNGAAAALRLSTGRMPIRAGLRWWPAPISPAARAYLLDTVQGGILNSLDIALDLAPASVRALLRQAALPPDAVKLNLAFENASMQPLHGLPPVAGMTGKGWLNAVQAQVSASQGLIDLKGSGRRIQLSDGIVDITGLDHTMPDLAVQFRAQAPAEAAAEYLSLPALRDVFPAQVNPKDIRGQFDGRARITLPLGKDLKTGDVVTTANATLKGVTIENAIGKDKLESANLTISTDQTGIEVKGDGRWQGMPVSVSVEADAQDKSSATVLSFTLDETAQRRFGLAGQVTGPLPVRIKGQREDGETMRAQVEVDLQRAAIDGLVPGFQKAAGRPGRLTFEAQERPRGGYGLQNIALDSGPASLRGQAEAAQDGTVTQARFSLFRLSPGDNVRLEFDRTPSGGRVSVRGNNLDARPFLRQIMQEGPAAPRTDRDMDLELKTTLLSGHNGEVLTNADVKLLRRNGQFRQIAVTGRLNGKALSVTGQASDRPAPLTFESDDAGATLRFMDLYTRMVGGDLQGEIRQTPRDSAGYFIARNFSLRNEPALRRLLSEGPEEGAPRADNAAFTKMRIDFTRTGGATAIRDAVIFGPQMGVTFNGMVDFARDRISLSGTYIPAYGLNNAFAQIPVLGNILGGGRNEGLLAVTFAVAGRLSQPQVSVNPLSAVAPGIFRKIFEFRNERTGATPPANIPNQGGAAN